MLYTNWKTVLLSKASISRVTKSLVAIACMSVLLTGCSLFPKEEPMLAPPLVEPVQVTYEVAEVTKGTITKSIKGSSTFTTVDKKELSFPETKGLRLMSFAVSNGELVKKGQVLAELDATELERSIEMALYEVEKAKLELQEAQQDNKYEVEEARLNVVKAEMNAKVSETKLAQIELDQARLKLAELQDPKRREFQVESAKLNVKQREMDLSSLQKRLADTKLVAPMDGVVLFVSNEQVGDEVDAYQPLVTIGDPNKLFIIYTAPEREALKDVKDGVKATIKLPDGTMEEGVVVQTPLNVPDQLPEDLKRLYQRSILIAPAKPIKGMEVGSSVVFEIVIDQQEDAVIIPIKALRGFNERMYVQVLDENVKKEVDVTVGIKTATEVEIINGLQPGQLVILD
ncbi:efflux RND transporter periplasmic adaptor subunit [Brevibacillus invocatus]|uniref:efflux RND transporter periplasmic adaptor subunit n=1 Tax=Brevibacillus invocatus TaxID=173959 RepID=UPI00203A4874|nr:HlyD family efflux transporter periplasmic adaptor subunit [Brevibacillus invocatus]MCM3079395.1 HlyD family efflux transporter periplasmic adaptor subunit [Brevibacillus invocatus]MCM3429553.1 HlyD family efflux transporter periplasmic adaptor subunit [Brevibacillus invocatus]